MVDRSLKTTEFRCNKKLGEMKVRPSAQVAKLVDARDLNILSTQFGNYWCEWSQIRGNLSNLVGGNPELSFGTVFTPVSWSNSVAIGTK